jgi:putative membrane protein
MAQHSSLYTFAGLLSALLLSCGGEPSPDAPEAPPPEVAAPEPPPADPAPAADAPAPASEPAPAAEAPKPEPLSDAQIAAVTDAANGGEVEQAKLAQKKAKHARVKKFAGMMVTDHGGAQKKQAKIVAKIKLTPADNTLATELKSASTSTLEDLKGKTGADFDKAYIDAQVTAHQKVLEAFDKQLLPNVKDADMKALLEEIRPKIEAHLKEAQDIQTVLAQAPAEPAKPEAKGDAKGAAKAPAKDAPKDAGKGASK